MQRREKFNYLDELVGLRHTNVILSDLKNLLECRRKSTETSPKTIIYIYSKVESEF